MFSQGGEGAFFASNDVAVQWVGLRCSWGGSKSYCYRGSGEGVPTGGGGGGREVVLLSSWIPSQPPPSRKATDVAPLVVLPSPFRARGPARVPVTWTSGFNAHPLAPLLVIGRSPSIALLVGVLLSSSVFLWLTRWDSISRGRAGQRLEVSSFFGTYLDTAMWMAIGLYICPVLVCYLEALRWYFPRLNFPFSGFCQTVTKSLWRGWRPRSRL